MEDGVVNGGVEVFGIEEDAIHVKEAGANRGKARTECVNVFGALR